EPGAALAGYRVTLGGLGPAAGAVADARRFEADAIAELAAADEAHEAAVERAQSSAREAVSATEAYETLRDTVGSAVAELQQRLALAAEQLAALSDQQRATTRARETAVAQRGRAEGLRQAAHGGLDTAVEERAAAAESLRRFTATGLLAVALPGLAVPAPGDGWAPDPTVRLARQIDQELDSVPVDDTAWDRVQRRVTDELKTLADTLARHGNTASAQLLEDGIVVAVVFRAHPSTVPELAVALGTEVADRQRLLDEREREILENHLVNEVASTLQELIAEAERQVRLMNSELDDRPTSTGMRLRLEWRPREDGPAGLAQARRRLLRQTSDAWSEDDRAAVGGFLQARIAEVRTRDEAGTWLEHLTTALDYRGWHRFVIERHQNGQWRPATGPASGGERVLAASVPLFAAASAHYASAGNPHAPRLVTLDEAFAGVDDNARAKYLGLLAAFDLDVVMTSEREWGCYPEVPGLAIAQLARTDGVAAVLVTNWQWDGERRRPAPRPVAVPAAIAPRPATGSLFDDL
ncbi:MAG: TIGR02680 family protein, partial [Pseudonocardia sp.]|nr:TIGR02680 family protein [Pseudonocardia sp.]